MDWNVEMLGELGFNFLSEGINVLIKKDCFGFGFIDKLGELCKGISLADDQCSFQMIDIFRERFEALAEKELSLGPGPRVLLCPMAQYIDGDDLFRCPTSGKEGGVVSEA